MENSVRKVFGEETTIKYWYVESRDIKKKPVAPVAIGQTFGYGMLLFLMKLRKQAMTDILCSFWWLDNSTRYYGCVSRFWSQAENSSLQNNWIFGSSVSGNFVCNKLPSFMFYFSNKYSRDERTRFVGIESKSKRAA